MFARLDRFEVECPSCGRVIAAAMDKRALPARLQETGRLRAEVKDAPTRKWITKLVFNPHTQRLKCPFCQIVYVAGLLLYPVKPGMRRLQDPPADTVMNAAQQAELRHIAGGWMLKHVYRAKDEVNLYVQQSCTCVPGGSSQTCPLHGQPVRAPAPEGHPV